MGGQPNLLWILLLREAAKSVMDFVAAEFTKSWAARLELGLAEAEAGSGPRAQRPRLQTGELQLLPRSRNSNQPLARLMN